MSQTYTPTCIHRMVHDGRNVEILVTPENVTCTVETGQNPKTLAVFPVNDVTVCTWVGLKTESNDWNTLNHDQRARVVNQLIQGGRVIRELKMDFIGRVLGLTMLA